jgi:membrane protease YdiL (CAAX protease family)
MTKLADSLHLKNLAGPGQLKPTVILISATVLLATHRHFGTPAFWDRHAPFTGGIADPLFMFLSAFLLLGLIPFAIVRWWFHEDVRDYGLRLGDWRLGLKLTALLFPVICVVILLPAVWNPEIRHFYPMAPDLAGSASGFALLEIPRTLFFYIAWEFFFRGFLLFGLRPFIGDWMAICVQVVPSCLWHIGLPSGELFMAIAGGLLFGVMALRTRSIVWPMALHALIGIGLDFMLVISR